MDGRRGGRRWSNQTILPLRPARQLSGTVSCWYCDFKFLALNEPLFRFGRRYSRWLRAWFSMGIGVSLAAFLGVTIIILHEFGLAALVYVGNAPLGNSVTRLSSLIAGLNLSLPSMGYMCISSVICIIVHEFGHALAAASEGVQMEYIAIFWAVLFPGALVAFNHASLQALPRVASLRIYSAGIHHNAAFGAVCALSLFLMPFLLSPFYIHGESPMVLDVPSVSPFFGYLSPHDVIFSLDGHRIHTAEEWKQGITILLTEQSQSSEILNVEKGYCIPKSLIEKSIHLQLEGNQTYCPNELTAFASVTCNDVIKYDDGSYKNNHQKERDGVYCLDAKDVVKLRKCGYMQAPRNTTGCLCSEVESCLIPMQQPGLGWVEITYSSLECHNHVRRRLFSDDKYASNGEKSCLQTFVFVGDLISLANSIHLTSYQPRWSIYFTASLPDVLEKLFTCSFHVSMLLALLNSLPVFFLDGECILEASLCYFDSLSSRMRRSVIRFCLLVGTFISTYLVLQTIFISVS